MTLRSSVEHLVRAGADFLERMRAHPEQERLVGLPGPVDADVRLRRGRQHAAQRVERLGPDRGAVHAFGVGRRLRVSRREVILHDRDQPRIGLERRVHRPHVALAQRAVTDFRRHVIAVAAVQSIGIRHVSRRLLEIRHQPAALEHLGQDVRDVLAGEMRAAELRDRVVSVFVEDPGVELFGASTANVGPIDGRVRRDILVEFVQEQPAQRLRRA